MTEMYNVLEKLRAAEERAGQIRWLRPEFQQTADTQTGMDIDTQEVAPAAKTPSKQPWPATLPDRVRAVRDNLIQMPTPGSAEAIARQFTRARVPEVHAILETLAALGQAHRHGSEYLP